MNSHLHPLLIEPTDTFFFRDSIPMSAGQGRGAGARIPLPSTLHEAFRASLCEKYGFENRGGFRPREADRSGGWLGKAKSVDPNGGFKDFQSLQIIGPFPFLESRPGSPGGLFFPAPLDLVYGEDHAAHVLGVMPLPDRSHSGQLPCVAVSPVPASKNQPSGYLSASDTTAYLAGDLKKLNASSDSDESTRYPIVKIDTFFREEYRIGVALDPSRNAAAESQLFSATHARPDEQFRLAAWAGLKAPANGEANKLGGLDFLILGGERRIARVHRDRGTLPEFPGPKIPDGSEPVILKWSLVTPGVFAHGWLPGWCRSSDGHLRLPDHFVCLKSNKSSPPPKARLIATCLGKPIAFAGRDVVREQPKPTQLAVPAGSVYYFLCADAAAARDLANLLHWRPRSDVFGEKGYGFGLCSLATTHPTSPDVRQLADQLLSA